MKDPAAIFYEVDQCRKAFPNCYVKVNSYDRSLDRHTQGLSFIVNLPPL